MLTGVRATLVRIPFASSTREPRRTVTNKLTNTIFTSPIIQARIRRALINVRKASRIKIAPRAEAFVTVHQIQACATISARTA